MTPPQTPIHSRHTSNIDFQSSPAASASSPLGRRQSRQSFHDPSTPLRQSFAHQDGMDMGVFSSGGPGPDAGGMGNLAAELAGAWDDEDDDEYYEGPPPDISFELEPGQASQDGQAVRDSGVDIQSPTQRLDAKGKTGSLSLPSPNGRGHKRAGSEYDGSEYGSDSDLESPGMPPSLVAKIDAVEHLVRRGTENSGSHSDGVFQRVTENLRDLGSQANVEGSATRLITAHSALGTHLNHQTRQFHNLAYSIFNPSMPPPDEETIDDLLPLLATLSENMPRPTTSAYDQLAALHSITADLVQTFNYMSDTLHMTRQATTTAARRLRSAKELVAEMRAEEDLREEGERWLTKGNWSERLRKRECADVCGDVVGGFEEVCNNLRAQMVAAHTEAAQA